ncbi:hypothetical protein [Catellatospora methionotrophica]|uniref:hypothetical protein n=1 Tax=Catellatospora methionotrophica TaxID=121620 RepID=UPI0033CD0CF3
MNSRFALPARLAARPFDVRRGLPVPYVSESDTGEVDFGRLDPRRVLRCGLEQLCSACGQPHEESVAFIGGPGGFAQRRYTDPPLHLECAQWSLALCPYLAAQQHRRRRNTGADLTPGFIEAEKADPLILAVAAGFALGGRIGADKATTLEFYPRPWIAAFRFDYTSDGRLAETGPVDLF